MFKVTGIVLIFYFFILPSAVYPQEIKERVDEIINEAFSKNVIYTYEKYEIKKSVKNKVEAEAKQRFFSDHIFIYKIFSDDKLISVGMLDNVYGKSQPITFIVLFDMNGSIITSGIVKYREPYGGGVSGESWNNQFKGKNSKSSFEVGKEISSISGATISVNSVSRGIKKLTVLFDKIGKDL
jgi:Na+-translocating ferredoxin:NAD+ oxidoreductase RnfG subunit